MERERPRTCARTGRDFFSVSAWSLALLIIVGMLCAGSAGRCIREGKFEGAGILLFFAVLIVGAISRS